MTAPNIARLLKEIEVLRLVASAAARLRRIGRAADEIEESSEEFWKANPDASRSLTGTLMAQAAYGDALAAFDGACVAAADFYASSRDDFSAALAVGPREVAANQKTQAHDE